jgi:hypothetical protein
MIPKPINPILLILPLPSAVLADKYRISCFRGVDTLLKYYSRFLSSSACQCSECKPARTLLFRAILARRSDEAGMTDKMTLAIVEFDWRN